MAVPEEIEEVTEIALNTYNNIEFKGGEEADRLLFRFLGQLLTTLKTKTETLNGDTT